jgi:hypothetical protein
MSAFAGCEALKSVCLPASLQFIGNDCFRACSGLELATFESPPSTNLKAIKQLPIACFRVWASLSRLVFEPDSELAGIERLAFAGCSSLHRLRIPESVEVLSPKWRAESAICEVVLEQGTSLEKEAVQLGLRLSFGLRVTVAGPVTTDSH